MSDRLPLLPILVGLIAGCVPVGEREFVGRVYDGATGERVNGYEIWIEHSTEVVLGDVDERGRYHLPSIPEDRDFTVGITAEGYRPFLSHNPAFATVDPEVLQSRYFDAYLFPLDLPSPEVAFLISLSGSQDPASGRIRFRPTSASTLSDSDVEQPAGVADQVWANDEDLQVATVAVEFTDGAISFAEGAFVYGVSYAVTVYAVEGHQDFTGTWRSGADGPQSWTLAPRTGSPLEVVQTSVDDGLPSTDGSLIITFNQPVELFASSNNAEAIDQAFSITTEDVDLDGVLNVLADDLTDAAQERGTSAQTAGSELLLEWDPALGLAEADPDDPITAAHWAAFNDVQVLPAGGRADARVPLSSLLGTTLISVAIDPPL